MNLPTGMVANPPWVTDVIARSYEQLQQHAAQWLPQLSAVRHASGPVVEAEIREYGCGAYGCVLPTTAPNVVMKVTTDDTEAEFAAHLSHTLVSPICTTYYLVMKLPGERHDGREMFFLWRESAELVGQLPEQTDDVDRAYDLINDQHKKAQEVYVDLLALQPGETLNRDARNRLRLWQEACEDMRAEPLLAELGAGMSRVFRKQRIFFGDVHSGNIGRVLRQGRHHWVITDPGHIAVVDL